MSINRSRLFNLLGGISSKDPKLFEVLRELILSLEATENDIATQERLNNLEATVVPDDVVIFTYTLTKRNVILSWENPEPGTIRFFELRLGTDWNTANRLIITGTTQAVFDPLLVGTTSYLIKSIDINGVYSTNAKQLNVVVPAIGNTTVTFSVIDNNVLLFWTEPVSAFEIDHYNVLKNGSLIGTLKGTFTVIFEIIGGTFEYSIVPVDIAENEGPENSVDVVVSQPTDFELSDQIQDNLTGTKVNCVIM